MIILGLTGSIGMGKSTTADMFRSLKVPVYDSDAAVHSLYDKGGEAVEILEAHFPNITAQDGSVDRLKLGNYVLGNDKAMKILEDIVHPMVFSLRQKFLVLNKEENESLVVLDIPLLFETGSDHFVDKILVVTASPDIQRSRVLSRPDMTEEKFLSILAKQLPDNEKQKRADFIIDTGLGIEAAKQRVNFIIASLRLENSKKIGRDNA